MLFQRYFYSAVFLLFSATLATAQPKSPAQQFPGLFEAVQMQQIYPDGKTFVDATPLKSAASINKLYQASKDRPGFDLRSFTETYFAAPEVDSAVFKSNIQAGIRKHIDTLWTVLKHVADTAKGSSLIPLPNDYVVPGGRFREVYYWDSYFTMLGLEENKRYDLIESMVKNFAYLIDTYGHIPNGNRSYYLSRSQPPFFALMVELLAKSKGEQVLTTYRPQLIKEYNYWMKGVNGLKPGTATAHVVRMADGSVLNRYWDASDRPREESYREDVLAARQSKQPAAQFYRNIRAAAESGWDFSSRWFSDGKTLPTIQTTSLIPVDLNSLLYHLEQVIARAYDQSGNTKDATVYRSKATKRKAALIKYCWNGKDGLFYDHNWQTGKRSTQINIATAFPLFFNMASAQQAKSVATLIKNKLVQPGGVACTLVGTGQQWDQPNGWAPLQYVAIMGLRNYQQSDLAKSIALRWMALNINTFKKTGKLSEKYDVQHAASKAGGGEYPLQDGFGWTNGVLLKLMNMYSSEPKF
jgi:alpha,alpha-trehalase